MRHIREVIAQSRRFHRARAWVLTHERLLMPAMLAGGVAFDAITFRHIELRLAFVLLAAHVVVVGVAIALINRLHGHRELRRSWRYARLVAPFVLQFSLGALLSASLIFYWFSGAWSVSWPLLLVLVALMVSNETVRHAYTHPVVQIGAYYFALFSVTALALPYAFNTLSPWMFSLAGIASAVVMAVYVWAMGSGVRRVAWRSRAIALAMAAIFVGMNAMYLLRVIPPIPLTLREAGVYERVTRTAEGYALKGGEESLAVRWWPGQTIVATDGSAVYAFTAVAAPAALRTQIVHHWQKWDARSRRWTSEARLSFPMTGGREDGYRGYSRKRVSPGRWRVRVETPTGHVLGVLNVRVVPP